MILEKLKRFRNYLAVFSIVNS